MADIEAYIEETRARDGAWKKHIENIQSQPIVDCPVCDSRHRLQSRAWFKCAAMK